MYVEENWQYPGGDSSTIMDDEVIYDVIFVEENWQYPGGDNSTIMDDEVRLRMYYVSGLGRQLYHGWQGIKDSSLLAHLDSLRDAYICILLIYIGMYNGYVPLTICRLQLISGEIRLSQKLYNFFPQSNL